MKTSLIAIAILALATVGCSKKEETTMVKPPASSTAPTPTPPSASPSASDAGKPPAGDAMKGDAMKKEEEMKK